MAHHRARPDYETPMNEDAQFTSTTTNCRRNSENGNHCPWHSHKYSSSAHPQRLRRVGARCFWVDGSW